MRTTIHPEQPSDGGVQAPRTHATFMSDCPACESGPLTLAVREGRFEIYVCAVCGTSVSLRQKLGER